MEVYTTSFFESIKFFVFTHTITTLLGMTLYTAVLGVIIGLAQGIILVMCLPKFNFSRWLLYNLLGFAVSGVPGFSSLGIITAMTATLAQYISLQPYLPRAAFWIIIMLPTSILCAVLYGLIIFFALFSGDSHYFTPLSSTGILGTFFAIGATCTFYFSVRLPSK
jgi:hypothetical protein